MNSSLKSLYTWLEIHGCQKEAADVLDLIKTSGVRKLPIDRSAANRIVEELLGELRNKLLKLKGVGLKGMGGMTFSPLMLHDIITEGYPGFFQKTIINPIIDLNKSDAETIEQVLAVSEAFKGAESYDEAINRLDVAAHRIREKDPGNNSHIDSWFLEQQATNTMPQNLAEYLNVVVTERTKNIIGDDIIINYLLSFSDARSGGGDAESSLDKSQTPAENLIVIYFHPGSLTLQSSILDYQANHSEASLTFEEEVESFISSIKTFLTKTIVHEQTHAKDIISDAVSDKGSTKWSGISAGRKRTLKQVAEDSGVKGGPLRLLVTNYNRLFGKQFGFLRSYQEIYDMFYKDQVLINKEIPEDKEVILMPSFDELYFYDKAFYTLSREELKAHLNDIETELIDAFTSDPSLDPGVMRPEDMRLLSETAIYIEQISRINPVDSIIKTPLGFLDKLKAKRKKDFNFGLNDVFDSIANQFAKKDTDIKKESVLKRRRRKNRGKGKRDRLEWALVSKKKPKKILKWFGPDKPSKKQIAKEEARIHAFAGA